MRMTKSAWALVLGLTLGCATTAPQRPEASAASTSTAPSAATTAVATAPAKEDPDKLICESRQVTGSRLPKQVCRTARQIEEERAAGQKAVTDHAPVNTRMGQ